MCGTYSLSNFLLRQGGLIGNYHANKFLLNQPSLTQVDSTINFNWGQNSIVSTKAESVSVQWTGFLRASTTGQFIFTTHSNDGVRVYLN